jgi:hypothetical protein
MTHLKIACGAVAILSLLLVFASRSQAPLPTPPVVAAQEPSTETLMVPDDIRDVAHAAFKAAALAPADGRVATSAKVRFEDVILAAPAPPAPPEPSNLCTRNGMKKVWVSKQKWKCQK